MTERERLASNIGGVMGYDPVTIAALLAAFGQMVLALAPLCDGEPMPPDPAEKVHWLAKHRPGAVRRELRREGRARGIRGMQLRLFAAEGLKWARESSIESRRAFFADADTGEWEAIK